MNNWKYENMLNIKRVQNEKSSLEILDIAAETRKKKKNILCCDITSQIVINVPSHADCVNPHFAQCLCEQAV